jgi:hypothetical protein
VANTRASEKATEPASRAALTTEFLMGLKAVSSHHTRVEAENTCCHAQRFRAAALRADYRPDSPGALLRKD